MHRSRQARPPRRRGALSATILSLLLTTAATAALSQEAADAVTMSEYEMGYGWFTRDKAYHFGVSATAAAGIYVLGREAGLSWYTSALASATAVTIAGLLRELSTYDPDRVFTGTNVSRKDLAWNTIGIVVGVSVSDRFLRERWASGPEE